jgi:hypothetical protein
VTAGSGSASSYKGDPDPHQSDAYPQHVRRGFVSGKNDADPCGYGTAIPLSTCMNGVSTGTVFQEDIEMRIFGGDRQKDFSWVFVKICEEDPRMVRLRGSEQDWLYTRVPYTLLS